MSIAQSAASFVGTKPTTERKPRITKPEVATTEVATTEVAAPSTFAALVQQIADAPKAAPKVSKVTSMLVLTVKGKRFTPRGKSEVSKTKDQITWPKIVALFATSNEVSSADILAAIPDHRDYLGYTLRNGWLATVAD